MTLCCAWVNSETGKHLAEQLSMSIDVILAVQRRRLIDNSLAPHCGCVQRRWLNPLDLWLAANCHQLESTPFDAELTLSTVARSNHVLLAFVLSAFAWLSETTKTREEESFLCQQRIITRLQSVAEL